jgi:hypothetical protein
MTLKKPLASAAAYLLERSILDFSCNSISIFWDRIIGIIALIRREFTRYRSHVCVGVYFVINFIFCGFKFNDFILNMNAIDGADVSEK